MFFLMKYKFQFISFILILIIIILTIFLLNKKVEIKEIINEVPVAKDSIYVDIKGSIKKPGVYEVDSSTIVNNVILLAGGITKNGTTKNINLSKKVSDEMIIYIYNKSELKKLDKIELNECKCDTVECNNIITDNCSIITSENNKVSESTNVLETEENTSLININTCTKEDLLNLNGIGESKAKLIINYRELNGPFNRIEDIMNVSGIGEALYAKIKEDITI